MCIVHMLVDRTRISCPGELHLLTDLASNAWRRLRFALPLKAHAAEGTVRSTCISEVKVMNTIIDFAGIIEYYYKNPTVPTSG